MFRFVVRHLRWLARVPGLPHFFDAMMLAWTALLHRQRLAAMEAVEAAVLELPGIRMGVHRLGGTGYILSNCEVGHMHGNGLLDVRVGAGQALVLVRARCAEPHHVFGQSAWVSFWIRTAEDVPRAMDLLGKAINFKLGRLNESASTAVASL